MDGFYANNSPFEGMAYHQGQYALNPSIPVFQPNSGMEMQRYDVPRWTPMLASDDVRRYIMEMQISHAHEMAKMEQQAYKTMQAVKDVEGRCARTYHVLRQQISELAEDDDDDQTHSKVMPHSVSFPGYTDDQQIMLPDEFYNTYSSEKLATAYLDEAERAERCAMRLKSHAEELVSRTHEPKAIEPAMPLPSGHGFACCQTAYGSLDEILAHVDKEHRIALYKQRHSTTASTEASMVTPDSSSRSVSKRSHAIEIKAPQDDHNKSDKFVPYYVTEMPIFEGSIPGEHDQTFSWEFLTHILKGARWSSGFYFIVKNAILPSQSYWLLDPGNEPFLPSAPGQHGAKLTAFFHEGLNEDGPSPENYLNVPVFIRIPGTDNYRYFGGYSQKRFSDKVSYDTLLSHIPDSVLRFWSAELAANTNPEWLTAAVMEHFWPKPKYEGRIPTDSTVNTPLTSASNQPSLERRVQADLAEYAEELKAWHKEARLKVSLLTADAIYASFRNADLDAEPGLRLWWEYFECVGYDTGFYEMLVNLQNNPRVNPVIAHAGKPGAKRPPTPVYEDDGSMALKRGEIDAKGRPVVPLWEEDSGKASKSTIKAATPKAARKPVETPTSMAKAKETEADKKAEQQRIAKQRKADERRLEAAKQAEAARRPTEFVRPDMKGFEPQPTKRPEELKSSAAVVKPTTAEGWADSGADMQAAKNFGHEVVKSGGKEVVSTKAKDGRGALPPHLRHKGSSRGS